MGNINLAIDRRLKELYKARNFIGRTEQEQGGYTGHVADSSCVSLCRPEKMLRVHRKGLRKLAKRLEDDKSLVAGKREASSPSQGGEMLAVCEE